MNTTMKSRNMLSAFISICSYYIFVLAESSCDAFTYGTPLARDCFDIHPQLPGGPASPNIDLDALRSFVEPKFLQPAFAPVYDPFNTEMVQLPKIWKKGTCCLALLSIATPEGVVQEATSTDKWRTVTNAFIDAVQLCIIEGAGKGGMWFANMEEPAAKVVYVYARGSPFEASINRYMSSYNQGLNPHNPNAIFVDSTSANSSIIVERKPQIT